MSTTPHTASGILRRLAELLPGNVDSEALLRGASLAFALQVAGAGLGFAMQVLLGRWLGPDGFGTYAYVVAWSGLLAVATGLGFPTTVLRFVPAYSSQRDWPRLRGILRVSLLITIAAAGALSLLATLAILLLHAGGETIDLNVVLGFWLVPLLALMRLLQEAARGFRRIGLAYSPSLVIRPLLAIAAAAACVHFAHLTSTSALAVTAAAIACLLVVQGVLLWRGLSPDVRTAAPQYETRSWIRVALPLLLIASFTIVLSQTDIVMVGAFLGPHEAGLYTAASKTAGLVGLVLIAVTAIAAPMMSSLIAKDRHDELQALVSTVARWIFWPSLAIGVFLAVLASPILRMFGPGFPAAHWELTVLLIGQLVNAFAGAVGYLMILSGNQREAAWVYGWVALIHVVLNIGAILLFGAIGAAAATSASFALWNVWLYVLVVKRLGIQSAAFSPLLSRHRAA